MLYATLKCAHKFVSDKDNNNQNDNIMVFWMPFYYTKCLYNKSRKCLNTEIKHICEEQRHL